jgi:enoyl-[acyl-carrier protein] reductase II
MTGVTRSALHTPLCDRLGIRYPICQAGMAFVARAKLAAAVSAAGGLGVIAAAHGTAKDLRDEIHRVRDLTDKPFGVDILFAGVRTSGQEAERFTDSVKGWIDVTLEERVPVLIAGLGNPGPVTAEAHRLGMTVMALCRNVKQARDHAANDVDVIIAQGHEGGGHTGRVGGVVLTPAVVDAVTPRLVVAAGGLADGRGLVAALALGAAGVWMGTRFIATRETHGHDNYKQKIAAIDEEGTVVTRAVSGKPNRQIRNAFTREWESARPRSSPFPCSTSVSASRRRLGAREEGDVEHGSAAAGQPAALIHDVRAVAEVMASIVDEAEVLLHRIGARA